MREWFDSLAPRERFILSLGAVGAVLIVVWGFVWVPLHDRTLARDYLYLQDKDYDLCRFRKRKQKTGAAASNSL